ncbi:cell division suppressor protein YneA [Bacillus testis]|uniref:cell division suppressor protein YneA n=1 Tax=Bacillus testis TaxID=1622072 RepID=UPI00067F2D4B|nr:LysM peptidoglycan-binding domain-containing protein [Bacillus testis]
MNYFIRKHSFSLLFFAVILLFSAIYFILLNTNGNQQSYIEVEVSQGDTLWGIAEKYNHEKMGTQDFIAYIEQTNQLSGEPLKAGEVLKIPVKKEQMTQFTME